MNRRRDKEMRRHVRVGLFGLLGTGNIGNDASMEVVLRYLREEHPEVAVDAMCPGPGRLKAKYGIQAVPLWHRGYERVHGVPGIPLRLFGKLVDGWGIASWVRRHDVVIVPGMGVMEATVPVRPWETPYAMFMLSVTGRMFRTKVALVSIGAGRIRQRMTCWLYNAAARLATYRSYRDCASREEMRKRGLNVSADPVYPDLVFGLPIPAYTAADPHAVGVGIMSYYGDNDERGDAAALHTAYITKMKDFIEWLADRGRQVRLFVGDEADESTVAELLAGLRADRPDLESGQVTAESMASFDDLVRAISGVRSVVATRYHNVMCALKLGKPVISVGYAAKNAALMADAGVPEFCQDAKQLDVDLLRKQFDEMEQRSTQLASMTSTCCQAKEKQLAEQFARLSVWFLASLHSAHVRQAKSDVTLQVDQWRRGVTSGEDICGPGHAWAQVTKTSRTAVGLRASGNRFHPVPRHTAKSVSG